MREIKLSFFETENDERCYTVKEAKEWFLEGKTLRCIALVEEGTIRTSPIVQFVDEDSFITLSGSHYKINGVDEKETREIILLHFINIETGEIAFVEDVNKVNKWLKNNYKIRVLFDSETSLGETSCLKNLNWEDRTFITYSEHRYHFMN